MLIELIKKTLFQVLSLRAFLNFGYLTKYFHKFRQCGAAMMVYMYLCKTPTSRPENSLNFWNILWLSRRLSTFAITLTLE